MSDSSVSINEKRPRMPRCAFFSSHCFVPLFVFMIIILTYVSLFTGFKEGPFSSLDKEINYSQKPTFLIQLSDLHFHHFNKKRTEKNFNKFKSIAENFNPPILIISGDLTDSCNHSLILNYHQNNEGDWQAFNDSFINSGLTNISDLLFIPIAGNHDEMAIPEDIPEKHPFRQKFLNNSQSFRFQRYIYDHNTEIPFNFIAFHPSIPPTPSAPMGIMPYVNKEAIEQLKQQKMKNHLNILVTHYPRSMMWSDPASTGKNIREATEDFDLVLTGHTHPMIPEISRFGDKMLHHIATSFMSNNFSIITFDNNMINIHNVKAFQKEQIVVTYPISSNCVTSNTIFNKNSFELRTLYFSNNETAKLLVEIDSKTIGELHFKEKLGEKVSLYALNISNIENGHHFLKIYSENEPNNYFTMDFFVGDILKKSKASFGTSRINASSLIIGITAFVIIYSIIRLIPFWKLSKIHEILMKYDQYIEQGIDLPFYKIFVYGIIDYFTKFRRISKISFIIIFILNVWIFLLPLLCAPLDDKKVIAFLWGIVIDGKVYHDIVPIIICLFYIVMFVLPIGSFAAYRKESFYKNWESILFLIEIFFILIVWFIVGNLAGGSFSVFTSPITYFGLIGLIIILFDAFYKRKETFDSQKSSSGQYLLNHIKTN